jgi:hypothetical protein
MGKLSTVLDGLNVGAISWNSFAARAEPVRLTTYGIRHYPQAQEYSLVKFLLVFSVFGMYLAKKLLCCTSCVKLAYI